MNDKPRALCIPMCCLLGVLVLPPAQAAPTDGNDDGPEPHWGADAKAYVTAPLRAGREQWIDFGGMVATVALAYQYDDKIRAHFVPDPSTTAHKAHNEEDALPSLLALGGTWIADRVSNDPTRSSEAGTMLEAALFATTTTEVLQKLGGRAQPNNSNGDRAAWRQRDDSFPSAHTTMAFAIGTVLAEPDEHAPLWRPVLGYGIGALTAYQRMKHDVHWFSDTVAGAEIGITTARFLTEREDPSGDRSVAVWPTHRGLTLGYERQLR